MNKLAKIVKGNLREFQTFEKQIRASVKELNSHWSRIFWILLNKSSITDFTKQLQLIEMQNSGLIEKNPPRIKICRSVKFVTRQRGKQSEFPAKFAFVNCVELMSKLWCFVSNKIIAVGILRNVIFPDLTLPIRRNVYSCRQALAHRFISILTTPQISIDSILQRISGVIKCYGTPKTLISPLHKIRPWRLSTKWAQLAANILRRKNAPKNCQSDVRERAKTWEMIFLVHEIRIKEIVKTRKSV